MKIAFYLGAQGKLQDKIVCLATLSKYSHVELVLDDGTCLSASKRDGGVRSKKIELGENWHVYDLTNIYDEVGINYWFSLHDGDKYHWLGAIGAGLNINIFSNNKKYCSQVVALMLGLESNITPGGLFRKLKKEKLINV